MSTSTRKSAMIRFVHKISPRPSDVAGPLDVAETDDLTTLVGVRSWLKRHKQGLIGRAQFRTEKDQIVVFPGSSIWHSMIITFPEIST